MKLVAYHQHMAHKNVLLIIDGGYLIACMKERYPNNNINNLGELPALFAALCERVNTGNVSMDSFVGDLLCIVCEYMCIL